MSTAHTPGPWRIGDAGHTVFGPPNGQPSPKTVAALPFRNPESRANAKLIAKAPLAPKLAEELRTAISLIESYLPDIATQKMRAALAEWDALP